MNQKYELRLTGDCSVSFTAEELLAIEREYKEYWGWHEIRDFAAEYLSTDADGWVSPEDDFDEVQRLNRTMFGRYMKEMAENNVPLGSARRNWPFLEGL
ncbi:hypothetical protein NUU61_003232 [Penicillium alfredii]|uniref:Uncharacterized protein n=1 Tax=Penicillium alfredii TaxID=1506179 RepID=A0A9W9KGQ3_9EURO|nr:uncharacterized protein NUU61_003232 [Penicillium alfredii]KAJ5105885.1 hypothetical protein NUU61_003232 [Penicillium alfredii]